LIRGVMLMLTLMLVLQQQVMMDVNLCCSWLM